MSERDPRWPHVTDILRESGLVDSKWVQQYHLDRGTAVHLATALDDEGDLDESTVDPAVWPYLRAYRRFREAFKIEILAREEFVVNQALNYCGNLDLRAYFYDTSPKTEGILDFKCGDFDEWHGVQTAGYAGTFIRAQRRFNLYLKPDGTYRLWESRSRLDWPVFKAAVVVAAWKRGRRRA